MVAAGYDGSAAPAVWQELLDEQSRSTFEKVRQQHARAGLFDDHPLEGARLDALAKLAEGAPKGDLGSERYRAAIRPHLAAFLRDDLRRRDFGETIQFYGIDRRCDVALGFVHEVLIRKWCGQPDSNRHSSCEPRDFKSLASTDSAMPASVSGDT